jgi:hypothetical protein
MVPHHRSSLFLVVVRACSLTSAALPLACQADDTANPGPETTTTGTHAGPSEPRTDSSQSDGVATSTGGVSTSNGTSSNTPGTTSGSPSTSATATTGTGETSAVPSSDGVVTASSDDSRASEENVTGNGGTTNSEVTVIGETSAAASDTASDVELPAATWPTINGVQWADTEGKPIQAHGGGVLKVGDEYYWFGENRNTDSTFYAVSAYRSRDLIRWQHAHDVLTMNSDAGLKPANVERPKVVYNAQTHKYVMWMHWENGKDYGEARAAVASSDTVDGDYTYHGSFRPLQNSGVSDHDKPGYMSRDCTLFVDDDGAGYFLSAANENYDLRLYRLSDDYLTVESHAALLFEGGHREAPALFKRGETYFLITSGATGWDPNQAKYATSKSLNSGWSSLQNVGDGSTFSSQSTFVLPVTGSGGTQYLYLGDRWAGAWDGRVNDSSYVWLPIGFASDTSMTMSWANNLTFDATSGVAGTVDAFTFTNKKSGMLLAVDGAPSENGADLVQAQEASAQNVTWRLNYDGAGYFRVTNENGSNIIDVPDESSDPGTHLHLWDDNDGDHQVWRIVDLGNGDFRIRNKKSGLYIGVTGGSVSANAAIEQQAAAGDEQTWHITAVPQSN